MHSWKWGGSYTDKNGNEWKIEPQRERVNYAGLARRPPFDDGGQGSGIRLQKFEDNDGHEPGKGLNGVALDDNAKMTLQQCAHALYYMDHNTDTTCGGLVHFRFHTRDEKSRDNCASATWWRLSQYVELGQTGRAEWNVGSWECFADFAFKYD